MNLDLTNDEIQELLAANNIPIINDETNYWFVRTSAGKHFEDFYFGQYIAIGWDKLNDLENSSRAVTFQDGEQITFNL